MVQVLANVHEDDGADELPELPLSEHANYVTARGLSQLHARLEDAEARLSLLSAEASLERNYLARHIRWLQARIASAIPVGARKAALDQVGFGATVEVLDDDDRRSRYRIVGEDEADPERGLVSWVSPLAKALTGARVGDTVVWRRPDGDVDIEVAGIDFGNDAPISTRNDAINRGAG
jgi:transcription elongation GreA/GreB family factor